MKKSAISVMLFMGIAVYLAALSFSVSAQEYHVCAMVSEFIETEESDDCAYFMAEGSFAEDRYKQLAICVEDGTDSVQDIELIVESQKQKAYIYMQISDWYVIGVEPSCPDSNEQEAAHYLISCVNRKIDAFRDEMGEDAAIRMDVLNEWEDECAASQ